MKLADDRKNRIEGSMRINEDGEKAEMSITASVDPTGDLGFSELSVDQTMNLQWGLGMSDDERQMSMGATGDVDIRASADWSDGIDLSMSLDDTASIDLKGHEDGLSLNFDIEGYACDHSSVWDGDYFNMNMTCDFDGERTVDQRFIFKKSTLLQNCQAGLSPHIAVLIRHC